LSPWRQSATRSDRSEAQAVEQREQCPLDLLAGRARVVGAGDQQRRLGERRQQQVRERADVGAALALVARRARAQRGSPGAMMR
jgi:hypothetical protein